MTSPAYAARLFAPGRKRVLAIDGGGVRGALAVGILRRIEEMLRARYGRPDLVLGDYFDLIAGTSTGAIIAAGLALGRDTADLERLYRELGPAVFQGRLPRVPGLQSRHDPRRLEAAVRRELGEATLGDAAWRTGFCAISKHVDRGSTWVLSNSPRSKYWDGAPEEIAREADPTRRPTHPNREFPLAKVVLASAAAPFFFDMTRIELQTDAPAALFFDGAITAHGNPALMAAMCALIPAYGFGWAPGADELLIVSVGTGAARPGKPSWLRRAPRLSVLKALPAMMSLTYDTSELALSVLQWLGTSPGPWPINREIGDLAGANPQGVAPLWTFVRYDAPLERDWMRDHLGREMAERELARLRRLDDHRRIAALLEIGLAAGEREVLGEHLPAVFDPILAEAA